MFPFWDDVIAPLIDAVEARRVIEIGALRGDTTVRMLDSLGADCELHVIDPLPQFDPAEHEAAFPGRYIFHLGISHDVLPTLPPADVALVDGDHNWYTVFNELKMLAATAKEANAPLPLLICHDVCWPYGRRDLYYDVSRIPETHRRRHTHAGMLPGNRGLVFGGMNFELDNAGIEGGRHNGVFTAVEDFIAQHKDPLRLVVLPAYFGLAIIADEAQLAAHPKLGPILDRFDTVEGMRALVELGERIRIDETITTQTWLRSFNALLARSASRYLALMKAALLDEHYIDNEVRLQHMARLLGQGNPNPDLSALRDPARQLRQAHLRITRARAAGRSMGRDGNVAFFPYTDIGRAQLDRLETALDALRDASVPGDLVEVGVGRGGGSIFLRAYLAAHEMGRGVWVVDEFLATRPDTDDTETDAAVAAVGRFGADLNQVRDGFARFDLFDDTVHFVQGPPASTLPTAGIEQIALVRFGEGLGAQLAPAFDAIVPRLAPGAVVIVSGTDNPGIEAMVTRARARHAIDTPLERIDWNSVTWTMPVEAAATPATAASTAATADDEAAPPALALEPPVEPDTVALSVVVVFYNMAREARRTLQSLTRTYQHGIDDLTYEVIAIDNGSDPDQRLTAAEVASYGPEFHLLDMGADAQPSPTAALNAGLALSRGTNVALMIDGAHVLTPGVLHLGMVALAAYEPAVVATQQWYVGPGQQPEMVHEGYDQAVEDRLFDRIRWPVDGYRLFEIGHFIGERDWFDGIAESNCVFAPRTLLEQIGGFDERFSMPGAGFANLDLFERLALTPGVSAASIIGEGSFHQFHGGTTTNVGDDVEHRDRVASYRDHFAELRGRPLLVLDRPIRYVGSLDPAAAKRTRPRRAFGGGLDETRDPLTHDPDAAPVPVDDELKLAAIEAVWDRRAWKEATWLGHRVNRFPTDLQCYQELFTANRPDVVIVTGDDDGLGGRALFAASVLDALGNGHVIAVGTSAVGDRATHPRVTHIAGQADDPDVATAVKAAAAGRGGAMVFLALGQDRRVRNAFEQYAPLVPVGGYVVIENTVVNGRPAAAGFGPGPLEAVFQLLAAHDDFVTDHALERYTVTFNRHGYLRRLEPK